MQMGNVSAKRCNTDTEISSVLCCSGALLLLADLSLTRSNKNEIAIVTVCRPAITIMPVILSLLIYGIRCTRDVIK